MDPRQLLAGALREAFDAERVVLCGSGTDALERGIRWALAQLRGDAIVGLPAYSCYDLATAVVGAGARVALYDLDPATLGPDLASLERVLADGARIVIIAPLYGMPVDWGPIAELTERAGAVLIEDAAQGQGAYWRGRPLGTLAPASVLSCGRGKGWTGGRGGALLLRPDRTTALAGVGSGGTAEEGLAAPRAPSSWASLMVMTELLVQWLVGRPTLYGVPASIPWLGLGETRYRDPVPASGLTPPAAAVLAATRAAAGAAAPSRRRLAESVLAELSEDDVIVPIEPVPDALPGYLRLPLRIPGIGAHFAQLGRARRLGLAPGYPGVLGDLPVLRNRLVGNQRVWPGSAALVHDLFTVPTHSLVSERDRERIVRFVREGVRSVELCEGRGR